MNSWYQRRFGGQAAPREVRHPSVARQSTTPSRRPMSSLQSDTCPACASGNYMAAQGTSLKRCLECGYPVVQSGSGMGSLGSTDGTVKAATQVPTGTYSPTTIIGRVD